jgi:hypothetical protein
MIFPIDHLDAAQLDLDEIQQRRNGPACERHVSLLYLAPPTGWAVFFKIL